MAKKIDAFMEKLANLLFDAVCITCMVFGAIALVFALTDIILFEGFINAFRRGFWWYMGFAALLGFGLPISKIFWKRYLRRMRRIRRIQRERQIKAELREEADV